MSGAARPQLDPARILPTSRADGLTPADLSMFEWLRIPEELLAQAHVRRVTDAEGHDLTGRREGNMAGILFDYHDIQTGRVVTRRLRRDHPEFEGGKLANKYISDYGGRKRLYLPPGAADALKDKETAIVLVEAEKSCLALTAFARRTGRKMLFVGMGGCYGWRGRIGKALMPSGHLVDEKGPSADLRVCDGRTVYVLLDSNAATSANVQQAQAALVRELASRNCTVLVCTLPTMDGINGPDDYLAACGDDSMAKVLDSAGPAVAGCDYGGGCFELADKGVSYTGPPDKEGNPKPPLWICSPLAVVAMTRDDKSGEWGRLLRWQDKDRVRHEWAMPLELLQRDGGAEVRCELARQGLSIAPGRAARDLLATYLQVWPVDARARCVDRVGWHGPVYLLPTQAMGDADETVVFQNAHAVEAAFCSSGTLEDWRDCVAALAQGNSRLVFAICTAFAATLLEPAGAESGGFHLRGLSSTGKSTALKLAASVWGQPTKYCRTWRATTNGLEGLAALHNDGLLILDELSQVDPRDAGEAAYLLANGQGKARASRNGTARQSAAWRLLFLSAGEESLSALMARAGRRPTAGQEIRLAEIEADAGAGMGAIETLHTFDNPDALVGAIRDAASRYHGTVGTNWLKLLVRDREHLAGVLASSIQRFLAEVMPNDSCGQIERVARRFAIVALAGEMATRFAGFSMSCSSARQTAGRDFAWQSTGPRARAWASSHGMDDCG